MQIADPKVLEPQVASPCHKPSLQMRPTERDDLVRDLQRQLADAHVSNADKAMEISFHLAQLADKDVQLQMIKGRLREVEERNQFLHGVNEHTEKHLFQVYNYIMMYM